MSDDPRELILVRQRKEKKELQGRIQALKKSSGKKQKKELQAEIEKLERDLEAKHLDELKNLSLNDDDTTNGETEPVVAEQESTNHHQPQQQARISKAQRRREKKSEQERERAAQMAIEEEESKNGPRQTELAKIKSILKARQLALFPILSDGDCLYNSILHQLKITGRVPLDVVQLRSLTADYILDHKAELLPYMTNSETDECLNDDEFEEYCEAVRSTKSWGGQIEIRAISNVLKVPIEVLQATGPPTVQTQPSFATPNCIITYHRYFVALGEHYNSTRPLTEAEVEENDAS